MICSAHTFDVEELGTNKATPTSAGNAQPGSREPELEAPVSDDTHTPDPTRKPISRTMRYQVLRRDGYTCRYCGAMAPDVPLTVDHVVPRALGGSDDPSNLVTACRDCNAGKAATPADAALVADIEATAFAFARALEMVANERRAEEAALIEITEWFYDFWVPISLSGPKRDYYLPDDWYNSVRRFVTLGFNQHDLDKYIMVALDARVPMESRFRYFCGCCWREIEDRQREARRRVEEGLT